MEKNVALVAGETEGEDDENRKKQKLLLMLQECDEQEAAEILPAIEYLLALIHKRGNSNE